MTPIQTRADGDLREALYNDRPVGPAPRIQMPREAVTRLHGLMVDLDANILEPNPWFPPGGTPEEFHDGIGFEVWLQARHQIFRAQHAHHESRQRLAPLLRRARLRVGAVHRHIERHGRSGAAYGAHWVP